MSTCYVSHFQVQEATICIGHFQIQGTESRRDQEEGGELYSYEEASPEEIKSREVVLG